MKIVSQVRIGTRLAFSFALVILLSMVALATALVNARSTTEQMRLMMEKPLAKQQIVADWNVLIYSAIARTSMIAKSSDDTLSTVFSDVIAESVKNGSALQKSLEPLLITDAEKAMYKTIADTRGHYQAGKEAVMKAKKSGDAAAGARAYDEQFAPSAKKYQSEVAAFLAMQRKAMDDIARAIDKTNEDSMRLTIALAVLMVLLSATAAWIISRSITVPMREAVALADKVAAGDLTSTVQVTSNDEIGSLMRALQSMNDGLKTIVSQVKGGTDAIATASRQIAAGNMDLSSRTEQQAGSLEETASAMEELTSTVKQNADNARQANQLAMTASEVAVKGGEVVSQVVDTMGQINTSARKIEDIISVIDGIAFQTNILALNAAVEAARAGEQGRGFAVVASEVRSLAQRSAAAAKEIKTLINDSVDKVTTGTKLVDRAGTTMSDVVVSVKRMTDLMSEITAASQEQSAGIEQVNQAIAQMDEATQQNAALVEEAAAAAASLQDQAAALSGTVGNFKLGDHVAALAVRPSAAVARPVALKSTGGVATRRPAIGTTALRRPQLKQAGAVQGASASVAQRAARPTKALPSSRDMAPTADGDWEEF
jgi:methyl-accepting chemotaxis protein